MGILVNFFSLLITISTPTFAVDSQCEIWLTHTAFGTLNKSIDKTDEKPKPFSIQPLAASFQDFILSEFRADPANYDLLMEKLADRIINLKTIYVEKNGVLIRLKQEYDKYGRFQKMNPFSEAWAYRTANINPREEEIKKLKEEWEALQELKEKIVQSKAAVAEDQVVFEASSIFQVAKTIFKNSENSLSITKALLGRKGDLLPPIKDAQDIYNFFVSKRYSTLFAGSIAGVLTEMKSVDSFATTRMHSLAVEFGKKYSSDIMAGLSLLAFKKGLNADSIETVIQTYEALVKDKSLSGTAALPLVAYFMQLKKVPTMEDLEKIQSYRQILFADSDVKSREAAFLIAVVLSVKPDANEQDFKSLLEIFKSYEREERMKSMDHAILAAATFLINDKSTAFSNSVIQLWEKIKEWPQVSTTNAAGLVFKILIAKYGVSREINPAIDASEVAQSSGDVTDVSFVVNMMNMNVVSGDSGASSDSGDGGDGDGGGE